MQSLNELTVGRFLGRYELLMPLAQGGMAAVWAARLKGTRGFQRVVAIKTILPSLSDDAMFEQMFLDEAALASRIRHPNVVQVLDLGEEGGLLYQVMEWIDGEPLSAFFRKAPAGRGLPYPIAARVLIGACDGLHAAHETCDDANQSVGLVHRDISPQNILVTRDGVPKVVDFGVAKASTLSSAATCTGTLKGKPAFMAPEQIQGEDIDRRADVFSLGVMLYLMTTSRHPFRGKSDMATLHNIVSKDGPEPPSRHVSDYPDALEQVVMTAINKDCEKRFASSAAMARALEAAVPDVKSEGDAEVAAFTRKLLSDNLEKRAIALRQSLLDADARARQTPQRGSYPTHIPATWQGSGGPVPAPPPLQDIDEDTLCQTESTPPAVHASTAPHTVPKSSTTVGFTLVAMTALLAVAIAAAAFFLVLRPQHLSAKPEPTPTLALPPTTQAASKASSTEPSADIAAEALPAASEATEPSATRHVVRPRAAKRPPVVPATSPASASSPTPPVATATAAAKAAKKETGGTSSIPGMVPRIRDPGF